MLDSDTVEDLDLSDSLLTQEVSDLNISLTVNVNNVNVNWEMRIHVSHLVLVTLSDTGDQVSNQRLDGSQGGNVLSVTVVDSDLDSLVGNLSESDVNVLKSLVNSPLGPVTLMLLALMLTVTPSGISKIWSV